MGAAALIVQIVVAGESCTTAATVAADVKLAAGIESE